jgi:Flp pilus assembly protein TadG
MKALRRRRERGGAVFEFALVFPLIGLTALGLVDVSRAMLTYHTLTHASAAAARFASVRSSTSLTPATTGTITDRVVDSSVGLEPDKVTVTATWTPGNIRGATVHVETAYPFSPVTPFLPWDTINLVGSAEARISN